jgi:hypothetical protein
MPGYAPPPILEPASIPVSAVPAPASAAVVSAAKKPDVKLVSKLSARTIEGEADPYWQLTPPAAAVFRVAGPRTLVFEARRKVKKPDPPTRVLVLQDGKTMMSALLLGDGEIETVQVDVPDGAHSVTLRTADARGLWLRVR